MKSEVKTIWLRKAQEQRYTLSVCYPHSERDFHGDTMTELEVEKTAWGFMSKDKVGSRVGLMHKAGTAGSGRVVESYIYRGPRWETRGTDGEKQTIKAGDWLLGVVWEPAAWEAIKSGEIRGLSLQGIAKRDEPNEYTFSKSKRASIFRSVVFPNQNQK